MYNILNPSRSLKSFPKLNIIRIIKKFIFILLFTLFYSQYCFSQKKEKSKSIIRYEIFNYLNDSAAVFNSTERINSRIGIKITNINKKLVDINSDIQRSTFNEEVPKLFETFSKATLPSASGSGVGLADDDLTIFSQSEITDSDISNSLKEQLIEFQETYFDTGSKIIKIENLLKAYAANYRKIKATIQFHSDLILLQNICNNSFDEILSKVKSLTQNTFTQSSMGINQGDKLLLLTNSDYIQNKTIINRYLGQIIDQSNGIYIEILQGVSPSNLDKISKEIELIDKKGNKTKAELTKKQKVSPDTKLFINKISESGFNDKLKKGLESLTTQIEKMDLKKLKKDFDAFETIGKKELFDSYDYFNVSNYTYYVNPQSIVDDLTVITVNIAPKEKVPCAPIPRSYELRIKSKSGIKIDFSTGFIVNFGGNDFLNQTYKYEPVPNEPDNSKIVQNDSKNSLFPAVGALMHIYHRNGKDTHFAGSIGISTSNLEKVNYHLGPSIIFGYSQRFIISGGLTLSNADLIDDKYKVGEVVESADAPDSIPTTSYNRIGYFLSFTYNLTSK